MSFIVCFSFIIVGIGHASKSWYGRFEGFKWNMYLSLQGNAFKRVLLSLKAFKRNEGGR